MKVTSVAAAVALAAATPVAAGYHYVTVDGPGPVLGTLVGSINDHGVATGYYVTPDTFGGPGTYTGFTVNADGSNFASFSRPGYAQTGASQINNAGDITGVSVTAMGQGNGFVRSGATGAYTDIVPTFAGAYYSETVGINNSGALTGFYVTDPAATIATLEQYAHGYIEYGGVFTAVDVDPSIGHGTEVDSINDLGAFTGSYIGNSDGLDHPFVGLFDPTFGAGVALFTFNPFGAPSTAVGTLTNTGLLPFDSLYPTPFSPVGVASAALLLDLVHNSAVPIAVPGAFSTNAFAANDEGQVTGYFLDATGLHGFIATPVPEVAAWALMVVGFGLVGAAARRRPTMVAA